MANLIRRVFSAPRIFVPGRSTPIAKRTSVFHGWAQHIDNEGKLLWESDLMHNRLQDEGEQTILAVVFSTALTGYATRPTTYFVGLDDRAAASNLEADTLASLSNEGGSAGGRTSGGGYSRLTMNTDTSTAPFFLVSSVGSGATQGYKAAAPNTGTLSWTASTPNWTRVRNLIVATNATATSSSSGNRLIATIPMSQGDTGRLLVIGDVLNTTLNLELGE